MKIINSAIYICCLIFQLSCAGKVEKPKITLEEYREQALTAQGMVDKIMGETDPKRMHAIAKAVEDSRAIKCVAISNECNVLSTILNKIVSASQDGLPKEADNVVIYDLIHELREEFKKGSETLTEDWASYNKSVKPLSKE